MNTYLIVKTLHILSATLMVGTGFGTAFYLFWANRSGSVPAQAVVSKWVIKADWWFTTPTVIFQVASGTWMIWQAGWPWSAKWIWMTLALYAFAGVCWLPVVWLQIKMARQAAAAALRPPWTTATGMPRTGRPRSSTRPESRARSLPR